MVTPGILQRWSQAVVRKAAPLFFPRETFHLDSLFFGPARTTYNYAADVQDGLASSVVMPVVQWLMRSFPEAPLVVRRQQGDKLELVPDHPLVQLVNRPNAAYHGTILWMASLIDWCWWGESYWRILNNEGGRPAELWWIPPWSITPKWPDDGSVFISHYEYQPAVGPSVPLEVEQVIHFRHGLDPRNMRHGLPPLRAILQDIWVDGESNNFVGSMLRNMGIPGLILSPKGDGQLSQADVERVKAYISSRFTGDQRGQPLALGAPTDVHTLSLSPTELDMSALRNTAEERVCCIIGTMIHTKRGVIPIEQVCVGDEVMTHRGRWRKVVRCFAREVNEPLVYLKADGLDALQVTANHQLYVGLYRKPHQVERLTYQGSQWIAAGDVKARLKKNQRSVAHALTIPAMPPVDTMPYLRLADWIPQRRQRFDEFLGMIVHASSRVQPLPAEIPMNAALGRLLGFYLAEGSKGDSRLYWAFHENEVAFHQMVRDDLQSVFGIEAKYIPRPDNHVLTVSAQSALVQDLFPNGTASAKKLPAWAWLGGDEFFQALLWAWAAGDGSTSDHMVRVTTISPHLAYQMRIVAISCGFAASVQKQKLRSASSTIKGRMIISRHAPYIVRWHRRLNPLQAEYRIEPDGYWTSLIREIQHIPYQGLVYNLAVEEDESYLTTGGLVHNCAALGIPAAVIGFGTGLDNSKVGATMSEFVRLAWSNGVVPMQRLMAAELQRRLLPLFETNQDRMFVGWDYDEVKALEPDQNELAKRAVELYQGGVLMRSESRQIMGYEANDGDEIYLVPSSMTEEGPDAPEPEPLPVPPAAGQMIPSVSANGNGNGSANGNGNRAAVQQRALTKQGSFDEWVTGLIMRRAPRLDHPPQRLKRLSTTIWRQEQKLQPRFQAMLLEAFQGYGEMAAIAAQEILFPQKQSLEDLIRASIIHERIPHVAINADLAVVYAKMYDEMVELTLKAIQEALDLAPSDPARIQEQIRMISRERVGLLDLSTESRQGILRILEESRQLGLDEEAMVEAIRDQLPAGRWSSSQVRAQIVARSESRLASNISTAAVARDQGLRLLAFDGRLGPTDAICEMRNGLIVSAQEAQILAGAEHPNGTLGFAPITAAMAQSGMVGT